MSAPPLISILMPVFNAAPFLAECLHSIIAQTSENWELIVVDDQSNDQSLSILTDSAKNDPRIKIYSNPDKGIIPALRLAFARSQGQVVTRMDADDKMAPIKLESLLRTLQLFGPGHLATGLVSYFSEDGLRDGYIRYEKWLNNLLLSENAYEDIYKECVIPSPNWMVYRQDLVKSGAFEPDVYPEDYDLCFRFYREGLTVKASSKTLHYWRDHGARTSRNDSRYSDNSFFALKVAYFSRLDRDAQKPLVLWGAGRKGKRIAKLLHEQGLYFEWICNNEKKLGKDIYGVRIEPTENIHNMYLIQLIIAVSAPGEQKEIVQYCIEKGWKAGTDFFLFC